MRQSPPRLLVLGLLSGTKTAKEIWYMIYAISSIYSSFWCETSRNWEGQLFFHFNFFFSFHFSPCTTSFKKKRSTFPVGEAILVTLPLPPKTLQCIFRISVVLTGAGLDKAKELWIWGKIVTYCYILKNPYKEETLKIFHQGHISCWYEQFVCLRIFLVGIRGPVAYETVAWRWLKPFPFRTLAIGQGWLHFHHGNLSETCTFIRILLRHGYGPKAFAEELWEALKYVLPASCLDEFAPEKQQTQVGKAQGWCFFLQYLPNYLQILVGLPFFCMHDHCQRKSLRNSSQLQDDICIHLQCI